MVEFRAYNKLEKVYYDHVEYLSDFAKILNDITWVVEQRTGFFDSETKQPVFEGDIIQAKFNSLDGETPMTGVARKNWVGLWECFIDQNMHPYLSDMLMGDIQIVGNIHDVNK